MEWKALSFICIAALPSACEGPSTEPATVPIQATEIEVSDFEDHGVELQLRVKLQGCIESAIHQMTGLCIAQNSMAVGERRQALVGTGTFLNAGSVGSLSSSMCVDRFDGRAPSVPHAWTIDATRLPNSGPSGHRFDIAWEHIATANEGATSQRTGDRRVVALTEGERYVLDWIAAPSKVSGCAESAIIEVMAEPNELPEFRARALVYDIWYVHTLPDGTELSERVDTTAFNGEQVDFRMPVVRPRLQNLPFADDGLEVAMRAVGSLRGRLRTDGAVDLMIDAEVLRSLVEIGAPMTGFVGGGGGHAFRVEPGQTLRLELSHDDERWRIEREGRTLTPDMLRAHADALIVTVGVD